MEIKDLIQETIDNLANSYAPYSSFKVSALLETEEGKFYPGVNIENASYSPTNCAERTAFFTAVGQGERKFKRIFIVGGKDGIVEDYTAPCGVCRQVMMEFCNPDSFEIILAKSPEDYRVYKLKDLLPLGFGPSDLCEV